MKKNLSKLILFTFVLLLFACNNNSEQSSIENKKNSEPTNNEIQDSTEIKKIDSTEITLKVAEDTIEHDYYSINYLEDFIKFRSHEQLENYFGKDNVEFSLANCGPASSVPISTIYKDYENRVIIIWQQDQDGISAPGAISAATFSSNYDDSKPGGSKFKYKSGLRKGMSLQELIDLNNGPIEFNDFAFSLGRQNSVGKVINSSLNGELNNYYIDLDYKLPDHYSEFPADYLYLEQFKTAWSNDPKVNVSKIYVKYIKYCPCRCIFWC